MSIKSAALEMMEALLYYKEALEYIYPKLNLKKSFLDAKAIQYMNLMEIKGDGAILKGKEAIENEQKQASVDELQSLYDNFTTKAIESIARELKRLNRPATREEIHFHHKLKNDFYELVENIQLQKGKPVVKSDDLDKLMLIESYVSTGDITSRDLIEILGYLKSLN